MAEADSDRLPLPYFCPSWHNGRIGVCRRYIACGFVCRELEKAIASPAQSSYQSSLAAQPGSRENRTSS